MEREIIIKGELVTVGLPLVAVGCLPFVRVDLSNLPDITPPAGRYLDDEFRGGSRRHILKRVDLLSEKLPDYEPFSSEKVKAVQNMPLSQYARKQAVYEKKRAKMVKRALKYEALDLSFLHDEPRLCEPEPNPLYEEEVQVRLKALGLE